MARTNPWWEIISHPLVIGALIALMAANLIPGAYQTLIGFVILEDSWIGHLHEGHRVLDVRFFINDILMALFFFTAGKEVWEAVALQNGKMRGRKAITPLVATAGGVLGPIAVYLGIAAMLGSSTFEAVQRGWAIPTATDIAFSYIVGCLVFGPKHPAVGFLLLLAIADDAVGLAIIAIFYPSEEVEPLWLLLSAGITACAYLTCNWWPRQAPEQRDWVPVVFGIWPYVVSGGISWFAFQQAGIHPALGLLPVILAIPHAETDLGIYDHAEDDRTDMLNRIEHLIKGWPIWVIMFVFGLTNAGVAFSSVNQVALLVLFALMFGKPLGIFLFGYFASRIWGLPEGMKTSDLLVLGAVAGIGFTVALFVAGEAFPDGPLRDAAKMGALLSLLSIVPAYILGRALKTVRQE